MLAQATTANHQVEVDPRHQEVAAEAEEDAKSWHKACVSIGAKKFSMKRLLSMLFVFFGCLHLAGQNSGGSIFWRPGILLDPYTSSATVSVYPYLGTIKYQWEVDWGVQHVETDATNHDGKITTGWGTRFYRTRYLTRTISASFGLGWQRTQAQFALTDTTWKVRADWLEMPAGMTFRVPQLGYFIPYFQPMIFLNFKVAEELRRNLAGVGDELINENAWAPFRMDIRLAAGTEYELGPKWSAFAQLQWRRSITNLVHEEAILNIDNNENFYFNQWNLAAGLIFTP